MIKVQIGDRFRMNVRVAGIDRGMGEAKVIDIENLSGLATLVAYTPPDPDTGKMYRQETCLSLDILERIKRTGEAETVYGIFPSHSEARKRK